MDQQVENGTVQLYSEGTEEGERRREVNWEGF